MVVFYFDRLDSQKGNLRVRVCIDIHILIDIAGPRPPKAVKSHSSEGPGTTPTHANQQAFRNNDCIPSTCPGLGASDSGLGLTFLMRLKHSGNKRRNTSAPSISSSQLHLLQYPETNSHLTSQGFP